MNFRRASSRDEPEINLIPLIDILIVVLIFLFLTTTYDRYAALQISLPQSSLEKSSDKPLVLSVAVDRSGRYVLNGSAVAYTTSADLASRLQAAAQGQKSPVVAISADAAATHQSVVNVMEAARIAGFNQISFTTQTRQ